MDRINTAPFGNRNVQLLSDNAASLYKFQPLTRGLKNVHTISNSKGRAASPEAGRSNTHARAKLRRSRSACDLRDMRPMKRIEPTLAPIPAKTSRLMSTTSTASNTNKRARIGVNNAISVTNNNTVKRTIGQTTKAAATRTATLAQASSRNKLTTASTSSATSGAGKTINRRIPPYDFKARYHDLLEKHKVLKEKFEDKNEQLITLENLPEQLEDTQSQLITTQNDLKHTQTIKECLEGQVKSQREKIESLEASLNASKDELELYPILLAL